MASKPRIRPFRAAANAMRTVIRALPGIIRRVYAAALAVLIVVLTYRALKYLTLTILHEHPTPPQITDLPLQMDAQWLARKSLLSEGQKAVEHFRSPPSHYHRVATVFPSDTFNDCARSGCHAPLPHQKRKELRAFLNMHATTIHCGLCHFKTAEPRPEVTWYNPVDGAISSPPVHFTALEWLENALRTDADAEFTREQQKHIRKLLTQAARAGGDDPRLLALVDRLQAVRPQSTAFRDYLREAREILVGMRRGAYGAKLAIRDASAGPILSHPDTADSIAAFFERSGSASPEERQQLLAAVHPLRRESPRKCNDCHGASSVLDLGALGYPASRVAMLTEPLLVRMIENIAAGAPFYLPDVVGGATPASTQPGEGR